MRTESVERARQVQVHINKGMDLTAALKKMNMGSGTYYKAKNLGKLNGSAKPEKTMVEKTIEKAAEMTNAPAPATTANNIVETLIKMILVATMPDSENLGFLKLLLLVP